MNTFRTRTYKIHSKKIKPGTRVRFALLADLHGLCFDPEGQTLSSAVLAGKADAALVAGDMILKRDDYSLEKVTRPLVHIAKNIPVFYSPGNHECAMRLNPQHSANYRRYERSLINAGVCFPHNQCIGSSFHGNDFWFYGLDIPVNFYRKPKAPFLNLTDVEKLIGIPYRPGFHVLLAHNPKFGNTYFSWGADLTVCGHYHGGLVRFGEHHGLISPQFELFPGFCCGDFHQSGRHMVVSAGLGEHTIPLRIHNPRELIFIDLIGKDKRHGDTGKNSSI